MKLIKKVVDHCLMLFFVCKIFILVCDINNSRVLSLFKKIQASIAQTLHRQTEASSKKRNAKATAMAFLRRSQGNYRTSHLRRRRNIRNTGQVSNDNEDTNDNDGGKDSSSGDEQMETKPSGCKRGEQETQFPQHSAITDPDGTGDENIQEVNREIMSASGTLAWGKNGQRSNNRVNGKNARNSRISRLVDHLRNSASNDYGVTFFFLVVIYWTVNYQNLWFSRLLNQFENWDPVLTFRSGLQVHLKGC